MTRRLTLDEACEVIVDCEHKTAPVDPTGEYFAVGTPAMRDNTIDYSLARRISHATFEEWTRRLTPKVGDVLLAREAPVGPVVQIPSLRVAPGQRTMLLRSKAEVLDPLYLRYLLVSPEQQDRLLQRSEGSTVAHLNVAEVRSFLLPDLPPLQEQQAIAATLGAIDDKIDSNRRLMNTEWGLAVSILERACVDDSFSRFGDVAEFHNSRRVPLSSRDREGRPGPYPYYGATGVLGYVDDYLFDQVMLLVGEDGSVVRPGGSPVVQYVWGRCWVNNHAHVVIGQSVSTELLMLALSISDVSALVTGAVQPKLSMGNLKSLKLGLPPVDRRAGVDEAIQPLLAAWRGQVDQNAHLAALRDVLLPELLSGRLAVGQGDDLASTAAERGG
ncbi:MAG: restriction endonuclease subunit S [Propionibacteriaceae bacterium]|nr:restriction endonuclease subunit S [Propionibacteriaceae bacterium]